MRGRANPSRGRYVVITDVNVKALYGEQFVDAMLQLTPSVALMAFPAGEASKTRRVKEEIEDWMLARACNRDTCIIALGGGVVGDTVGFVAATFLRGVPYIQVQGNLACYDLLFHCQYFIVSLKFTACLRDCKQRSQLRSWQWSTRRLAARWA